MVVESIDLSQAPDAGQMLDVIQLLTDHVSDLCLEREATRYK